MSAIATGTQNWN